MLEKISSLNILKINIICPYALKKLYRLFLIFYSVTCFRLYAQESTSLEKFELFGAGGKVFLNCLLNNNSGCSTIDVLRSEDTLNFQKIGSISAICGSPSKPIAYNFVDEHPIKNKTLYYRLELPGYFQSSIKNLYLIDLNAANYMINANPSSDFIRICFRGAEGLKSEIIIFDNQGTIIKSDFSYCNKFDLNKSDVPYGVYYFTINTGVNVLIIRGKLLIQN